jgi:methyl-accepting chemotaxis protein
MSSNRSSSHFEQSFMFHMIRDFFLLLLAVAAVEMAIRYAALRWDFAQAEPQRVDRAAQQLANDIRSIMLNAGGPVAAQTVYPILNRNYNDLGLSIAVEPAPVTIASMKESRGMDVQGLRASWVDGAHQAASVSLKAEQYCLSCHVKAQVGDVLGTVSVRSYLARKESVWWQDVRLTAGALSLKILAHTIVLFLLLKVRMAPLLALRTTVSGLAKGVMDLSPRAAVNTQDEFGELAQDLNHFLDRVALIVRDLDSILSKVVDVGTRLGALNKHLELQLDGLRDASLRGLGDDTHRQQSTQLLAAREGGAFGARLQALLQTLDALAASGQAPAAVDPLLRDQLQRLQGSFEALSGSLDAGLRPQAQAEAQAAEYRAFAQSLRDMAALEATMQAVAESGQQVIQRLTHGRHAVAGGSALANAASREPAAGGALALSRTGDAADQRVG